MRIANLLLCACCITLAAAAHAANHGYCRPTDEGTRVEYAPEMLAPKLTPPTASDYLAAGWFKNAIQSAPMSNGYHVASVRYEARDGAVIAVYSYEQNQPRVRRWTPLAIKRSAVRIGHWDALKNLLVSAGAYDDFVMAQYEAEDDADFVRLMSAAREQFGNETVDAILNGAEEE